jgi:uncharacterized protein YyaL (SSP411 family)
VEIVVVGSREDETTRRVLEVARRTFIPNRVLVFLDPGSPDAEQACKRIPLLRGKAVVDGKPAVYVCENGACKLPVTDVASLEKLLDERRRAR